MLDRPRRRGAHGCAAAATDTPATAPSTPRLGLRVLLVEDNSDHAILVARALSQRGHRVTTATDAAQALAALAAGDYDVAAVDYQLPDATGLEVLSRLSNLAAGMPVVMVTASGNEQVAVAALKNGARDYVVKLSGYERVLARSLELAREQARAEAAEAALRAELERRAITDYLTGLLNRGEMERRLLREIARAGRYRRAFSFALMDIDGFKEINDRLGHPAGDAVLCRFARLLESATRASDSVARWGGDEFAALLPEASVGVARAFAERLRSLLTDTRLKAEDATVSPITVSCGFVSVMGSHVELPLLVKWADRALYDAKAAGRSEAIFTVATPGGAATEVRAGEAPPDG